MDRDLVEGKIESLRRCIDRIQHKTPGTADQLRSDLDLQDIIALNLQRAIQLSVDIAAHLIADTDSTPPTTMGENFDILAELNVIDLDLAIRLKKAVGFRNIAVHNYQQIDWNIVYSICTERLSDFVQFARKVHACRLE